MADNSKQRNQPAWASANTLNSIPASWDETVVGLTERLDILKDNIQLAYVGVDKRLMIRDGNKKFNKLFDDFPSRYLNRHLNSVVKSPQFASFLETLIHSPRKAKKKNGSFVLPANGGDAANGKHPAPGDREILFFHLRLNTGGYVFFFEEKQAWKTPEEFVCHVCDVIRAELEKATGSIGQLASGHSGHVTLDEESSDKMCKESRRLRHMAHQLETYAKWGADYTCASAVVSLSQAANQALNRLRTQEPVDEAPSPKNDRYLLLEVEPAADLVHGEFELLEELFYQLLHNAWTYRSTTLQAYAQITRHKDHCAIQITSRSRGISPGLGERVFEPFFKAAYNANDYPGVGLGLAIARRVVELHGGEIVYDSSNESSAGFRIHLPLMEENEQGDPAIP